MSTQKELIRDSISDLLMENDIDLSSDISDNTLTFQKAQTINYYDGGALLKAKNKAEKVMNTLLKLYMSDGFINKSEYIQAKVNLDSMTLGKIMNQMEVSEAAIQVLMDNIQMGDVNPKLFDALGNDSLGLTFLKGYQWPFDVRKVEGSSQIDLFVAEELAKGRRVYLDFTHNPRAWTEQTCFALSPEAYWYLHNSDCLFGTPIRRLKRLNPKAVELYASHGIDLSKEKLEIAVCAQHINGGVAVDANWESSVRGLYAAGEAAGTFGVYRPGGSALNATQVGALRAAEHIASLGSSEPLPITYNPPSPSPRFGRSTAGSSG